MTDENKKLVLDDEHLAEITKKISTDGKGGLSKRETIFTELIKQQEAAKPELGANPLQAESEVEKIPKVVIKNLRTFQGDASEVIKSQNTSVLSIAIAEKKRAEEEVKTEPLDNPEQKKKVALIIISVLLVILGVSAVALLYYFQKKTPDITSSDAQEETIIGFKIKESIDVGEVSRDKLLETLIAKRQEINMKAGEVAYIALTKKAGDLDILISPIEFFALLKTKAPGSVLRAFDNNFMFGFYRTDVNEPFILIKLSSFENSFDGMLKWEENMNADIGALFTKKVLPVSEVKKIETAVGTSTASTTTEMKIVKVLNLDAPVLHGFVDEAVNNKDTRVLLNMGGGTILLYSFVDENTLLITTSRVVLKEMVSKIISQKLIR